MTTATNFLAILGLLLFMGLVVAMTHLLAKRPDGTSRYRMLEWTLLAFSLLLLVGAINPAQLQTMICKAALVVVSGVIGFFFDRGVAPYARPDSPDLQPEAQMVAGIRRALIIGAFVIAGALGA